MYMGGKHVAFRHDEGVWLEFATGECILADGESAGLGQLCSASGLGPEYGGPSCVA